MGNFLLEIKEKQIQIDGALLNCSSSKLIEYYSCYKSICEGYTINIPEYTQIFGSNQLSFVVWDTKGRGKIDAIEMFTGLVIFSNTKYQQKVKFLFQMFDLNEQGKLDYENLVFMLMNICNACFKIYQINKNVNLKDIEFFVNEYYFEESEIQYEKLLRWGQKVQQIIYFFKIIGHQVEPIVSDRNIVFYDESVFSIRKNNYQSKFIANKKFNLESKFIKNLQFLMKKDKVDQQEGNQIKEQLNPKISWVYGIRIDDIRQPVKWMKTKVQKATNERLLYMVGKLIIIYFPKLNLQRYYAYHAKEVGVIEISENKKFVASGEIGQYPDIHIWSSKTHQTLIKFKKLFKHSIKFLRFFNEDNFLIAISEKEQSPVILLNLITQQIIMSTCLNYCAIDILTQSPMSKKYEHPIFHSDTALYFCVLGKNFVTYFAQKNIRFEVKKIKLSSSVGDALCFVEHPTRRHLITAHSGRILVAWGHDIESTHQIIYKSSRKLQIIQIIFLGNDKILLVDKEDIEILFLKPTEYKTEKNMMLQISKWRQQEENALFNLQIVSIVMTSESSFLLITLMGDIIKIQNIFQPEALVLTKYYQVFKFESLCDFSFTNKNDLIICSSIFLYVVDQFDRQLKAMMKLNKKITLMNLFEQSLLIVAGDNSKSLYIMQVGAWNIKEEIQTKQNILDAKICDKYLIVITQGFHPLQIFYKYQDSYFKKDSFKPKTNFTPLQLIKCSQNKTFAVICSNRDIIRMTILGNEQIEFHKLDKGLEDQINSLEIFYPYDNLKFPFIMNLNRKVIALGKRDGQIQLWQSTSQALTDSQSCNTLNHHAGEIVKIILLQNQFLTGSLTDGMLIVYKHQKYIQIQEIQDPFFQGTINQQPTQKRYRKRTQNINSLKNICETSLLTSPLLKDSQIKMISLNDGEQQSIKNIICNILSIQKGQQLRSQIECLHLQVKSIYGLTNFQKGKHLLYLHQYPGDDLNKKKSIFLEENKNSTNFSHQQNSEQGQLQYAQNSLLPIDDIHQNCRRLFVYFSDRFCTIRQISGEQSFYHSHRRKVSCIAVHPSKQIVCSCEVGLKYAIIHIWKYHKKTTISSINSRHPQKIDRAQFSRDGEWLLTLGGVPFNQSIQITHWLTEQILGFCCIIGQQIRQILFNPYDNLQICAGGCDIIRLYRMECGILQIKEECQLEGDSIKCIAYSSSMYGKDIQSDVITGNESGNIGLYICGKHIISKQKAHQGSINCLKMAEIFNYKTVLITGGSDSYIRIWDIKFNQISSKNLKEQLYATSIIKTEIPLCQVNSLDIFQCVKQSTNGQSSSIILIGMSDGSVLEAKLTNEFRGYEVYSTITKQVQVTKQKINCSVSLMFSSPYSVANTKFELKNPFLITYSRWTKFILLWDIEKQVILQNLLLRGGPTTINFFHNSLILAIGHVQKNPTNRIDLFCIQNDGVIKSLVQCGQINLQTSLYHPEQIVISENDCKMAVALFNQGASASYIALLERDQSKIKDQNKIIFHLVGKVEILDDKFKNIFWMNYSIKTQVLIVCLTDFNSKNIGECKFKGFCTTKFISVPPDAFEYNKINFAPAIKASYIPCDGLYSFEKKQLLPQLLPITCMVQFQNFILMGTSNGQIIITPHDFFARKENSIYYAKIYVLCDSAIQKIQIFEKYMFVSSKNGTGILRIKLQIQDIHSVETLSDPLTQNIDQHWIEHRLKKVYPKRRFIQSQKKIQTQMQDEQIQNLDELEKAYLKDKKVNVDLELHMIMGRNAIYNRNNLFIDLKDNIISHSGCNLLIMKKKNNILKQKIIKIDASPLSNHSQISSLTISQNKFIIFAGTNEQHSKLIAWNIATHTYLFEMKFFDIVTIPIIRVSATGNHAVLYAINKKSISSIIFVEIKTKSVLAQNHFYQPLQVNDISFILQEQFSFLVCGRNYLAQWTYQNEVLTPTIYNLKNPKDFIHSADKLKDSVIFYTIIFVKQLPITSGSDGHLYIWKDRAIIKKQHAHPKEAILCLYTTPNSNIFVSGATDGQIIIWHFGSSLIIQKIKQFLTFNSKEIKISVKYHIQSICMVKNALIVGNRGGQILQFQFESLNLDTGGANQSSEQIDKNQNNLPINEKSLPKMLLAAFDNQKIISCCFNSQSNKLFVITNGGVFTVFNLLNFQKLKQERIQMKSQLIRMFVCQNNLKVIFILKYGILTYSFQNEGNEQKNNNKLSRKKQFPLKNQVEDAILNTNEKYLAILYKKQNSYQILIYSAADSDLKQQDPIDIPKSGKIDFSVDYDYIRYQNDGENEEQIIYDLIARKQVKLQNIECELDWKEYAKRKNKNIKQMISEYGQNNLLHVVQILDKAVVGADEMGSLRIFDYPVSHNGSRKMYVDHLNQIYICVLSSDAKYLVTVGKYDRAIHIWKVKFDKQ